MLTISFVLMMLVPAHAVEISYIDSRISPKFSWVLVDDCAALVLKADVQNTCKILKYVNNFCHMHLKLEDCDGR